MEYGDGSIIETVKSKERSRRHKKHLNGSFSDRIQPINIRFRVPLRSLIWSAFMLNLRAISFMTSLLSGFGRNTRILTPASRTSATIRLRLSFPCSNPPDMLRILSSVTLAIRPRFVVGTDQSRWAEGGESCRRCALYRFCCLSFTKTCYWGGQN